MAAAIVNHGAAAAQAFVGQGEVPTANAASGSSNGDNTSDATTTNSATISANDFLTLLVTEMQNQDPTANTDPNEYINQLVQVNSLEQLIDINQTLSGALGSTAASTKNGSYSAQAAGAGNPATATPAAAEQTSGNLGVPAASAAAERVAHALDGQSRVRPEIHGVAALR